MSEPGSRLFAGDAHAAAAASRRHSPDELARRLGSWLAGKLGVEGLGLTDLTYPVGAGTSSATVLATAVWPAGPGSAGGGGGRFEQRQLTFRLAPDRFQLFFEPDFVRQYRVLEVLHARPHGVRVAEPLYYEPDPALVGVPFYAMSRLHGWVPVSNPPYNAVGRLFDATPAARHRAWSSAMAQLCAIARVPADEVGFLDRLQYGPSGDGLTQEVEYWRRCAGWMAGGPVPDAVSALWEWLDAHRPTDRPGLSWGDARIGNMMFGEDFEVAGVMDWEQATAGGPRLDLGWWLFFDPFFGEAMGLRRLDGLGTRQETLDLWQELVGEPPGDTRWFEVFAGLRVALLTMRTMALMGAEQPRDPEANLALVTALRLADLPVPS